MKITQTSTGGVATTKPFLACAFDAPFPRTSPAPSPRNIGRCTHTLTHWARARTERKHTKETKKQEAETPARVLFVLSPVRRIKGPPKKRHHVQRLLSSR